MNALIVDDDMNQLNGIVSIMKNLLRAQYVLLRQPTRNP